MKLSEIIKRVQRQFGDDIQAQITKEDIVRWANDACLEIVINNNTNQATHSGSTLIEAGKVDYALPVDLYLLRGVRANGRVLQHTTYEQLVSDYGLEDMEAVATGDPAHYFTHAGEIQIYPIPESSLGTLDIMYIRTPTELVISNLEASPDVPVQYHPRIVEYCIAQAAELDDNIGQYQLKMNQFEKNLQNLKRNGEQPEGDDYYPSISYVGDGGGNAYEGMI